MRIKMLALATAVALTGCGTSYEEDVRNQQAAPAAKTSVGIPGPTDAAQRTLSEQVFAALGSQASALPGQIPAGQLITCADNTVSLRTLDLVDALALDVSNGQQTLTAPQQAALAGAVEDLLLSVGGLVLSLGGNTSCQLDPAMLGGGAGGASLPGLDQLPAELRAPLIELLDTLLNSDGGLDPNSLTAQLGSLNALSAVLQSTPAGTQLPLVPGVLELVLDTLEDVVALLTTSPNPTAYQAAVTRLIGNLTANLQALPTKLAPTGASPLPSGGGLPIPTNPADGLGALTQQLQAVSGIPVLGAPLVGLLGTVTGALTGAL